MKNILDNGTIHLRAPEPEDIDLMYLWENDPSTWTDGSVRVPTSYKLLHDFVTDYNPDPNATGQLRLIIVNKVSERAVGCIDLYEFDSMNRRAGVGIVIDAAHRGHGYARQALMMMARYAGVHLGLHQLWAIVGRHNEASMHLFSGAGFKTCGNLRSWIRIGRRYTDALMFQLLLVDDSVTQDSPSSSI